MVLYIGADHRGFGLKEFLKTKLKASGYTVVDVGAERFDEGDDYPDFAEKVAQGVATEPEGRRGIVICGSGAGADIVANKFKGIRSVLAATPEQASVSRNDDDTNVLAIAADYAGGEEAKKIVTAWLVTPFAGEEKYRRRIGKIAAIEERFLKDAA